jgi:hypothetical protein
LQGRRDESLITENGHQRLLQATVRFYLQYSSQFELDRCLKRRAEEVDDERVRERSAGGGAHTRCCIYPAPRNQIHRRPIPKRRLTGARGGASGKRFQVKRSSSHASQSNRDCIEMVTQASRLLEIHGTTEHEPRLPSLQSLSS